jgi:dihydroflavonol-4-reductase
MILVTGGTGLVGAHLLLHLVENDENVRALYRKPDTIQKTKSLFLQNNKENLFDKIHWMPGDILDIRSLEKAFENIEYVYHCAALISFDPKDENLLRKTNIEGTANVVNFCIDKKIKKLCHVSSIAAIGDLKEGELIFTEQTEWNPELHHGDYAISKYGAEMEIWRGQQEGIDSVIVNPGVILGPNIWEHGSGLLFKKIKNGFAFYPKGKTGFIAVTDVVHIMTQLMKSNLKNERFILIADNIMFEEFFNFIADSLQTKRPYIAISPFMTNLFWRLDWIFSNVFRTKRKLDRATAFASYTESIFSNEKIKNKLQFEFTDIPSYINKIATN